MAYKTCSDCGCKLYSGICSNCDEELYIETYQGEYMVGTTEDWDLKIEEQELRVKQRLKAERAKVVADNNLKEKDDE